MIGLNIPLKTAAAPGGISSGAGVYLLRLNGRIMKVGSAKIGVQKRMQQYYGLNPYCGLNCFIHEGNRDGITVTYQLCSTEQCKELESKLFDKYGPISSLPWATRRPHTDQDTCLLQI